MSAHQLHRSLARLNLRCFNVRPQRVQILRTPTAFTSHSSSDATTQQLLTPRLLLGHGPLALNLAEPARAAGRGVAVNVTLTRHRPGRRGGDGGASSTAWRPFAGGDITSSTRRGARA